jgi:hypothetical protein
VSAENEPIPTPEVAALQAKMPPPRDQRSNMRMVRVLFYLPGFMALLLVKAGEPAGFGITVEMLMLSSAAAVVGGFFLGSFSPGKRAGDTASKVGLWAGQVVLEMLALVPFLMAVPPLFHELATSTLLKSTPGSQPNLFGVSELIPAAALIPFITYLLAGFSTIKYLVSKPVMYALCTLIVFTVLGGYTANRNGWYEAELIIGGTAVAILSIFTVVAVMKLKEMQEELDAAIDAAARASAGAQNPLP